MTQANEAPKTSQIGKLNQASVERKLALYSILNNDTRLKAFRVVHDSPGISFNELSKKLNLETGLAAYHVSLLKANGLLDASYERKGKDISHYSLAPLGEQVFEELFSDRK